MENKKVTYSSQFKKSFLKRFGNQKNSRNRIRKAAKLFESGVRDAPIYDHVLKGSKKGLRSFSAGGDIRVIYRETDTAYEFLDVGSHNQVY